MNEETKKPQEEQVKKEVKETNAVRSNPDKSRDVPPKAGTSNGAKAPEAKPADKVPPVAAEQKKEAGAKKREKINCLTLEKLEKKIQEVQEKMGGLTSTYARQLLKRKEQLSEEKETRNQHTETGVQKKEETVKSGGDNTENE